MALYSERRHRLHGHELEPVLKAVRSELGRLLEDKKDLFEASALFRVIFRFEENKHGRPSYPEPITWGLIEDWLDLEKGPFTTPIEEAIARARSRGGPNMNGQELTLEEQNFRNLVHFYRDELRRVLNGERVTELFPGRERGNLKERGILHLHIERHDRRHVLTSRAEAVLAEEGSI